MEQLIISLVAGAVGGNAVGVAAPKISLGTLGNSLAGLLGGGVGGSILAMIGAGDAALAAGGPDIGTIIGSLASGGVGGGAIVAMIGVVRNKMAE